jgi:nitrite reductase/ring-hydroxylating ferredoxin subunit
MQGSRTAGSPVDPRVLEPVLAAGPDEGRGLPATTYTSQAVLAWELRWFFEAGWVCVGRADELATPGDQHAVRIGNEGVLVIRGADGVLRGFFNTCRHRGHELLEPGGRRATRAIRCPYHAWVYRLDGTLAATPRFGDVEGFDKDAHPLVGARIEAWRGWAFANADGDAPPLRDAIAGLDDPLAPREPERSVAALTRSDEVRANWKTIVEHLLESRPHARGAGDRFCVLPSLVIELRRDHVISYWLEPTEPGRTRVESRWLASPDSPTDEGFEAADGLSVHGATRERWRACEAVHERLANAGEAPAVPGGVASPAFVTAVVRGYLDGRVPGALRIPPAAPR